MSSEIKLLPCPFCGGEAKYMEIRQGLFISRFVTCTKCGIETKRNHPNRKYAVKQWNTRKPMEHYKLGNCTNDCEHFDNAVTYGYTKAIDDFLEKIQWEYLNSCGIKQQEIDFLIAVSDQVAEQLKEGGKDEA